MSPAGTRPEPHRCWATALVALELVSSRARAEHGEQSTYRSMGAFSGFYWMSQEQPAASDCIAPAGILPPAASSHCGPGGRRSAQKNALLANGQLTLAAGAENAQVYMCGSHERCASEVGTTPMWEAVANQQRLGLGTLVWQAEGFTSTVRDARGQPAFPRELVLGLYLYGPNAASQDNVDATNWLGIEYHNWEDGGPSTVSFSTWPARPLRSSDGSRGRTLQVTRTSNSSSSAFPSCNAVRRTVNSVEYALWRPVRGTCEPTYCFRAGRAPDGCVTARHTGDVPVEKLMPAMKLWWAVPAPEAAVNVTLSGLAFLADADAGQATGRAIPYAKLADSHVDDGGEYLYAAAAIVMISILLCRTLCAQKPALARYAKLLRRQPLD